MNDAKAGNIFIIINNQHVGDKIEHRLWFSFAPTQFHICGGSVGVLFKPKI